MHSTINRWPPAAHGAGWFQLNRHDDPEPTEPPEADADPGASTEAAPEPEPEGSDKLGDAGKKALDRMKAERAAARQEAATAKREAAELARKVAEFEDRDKSDLERATSRAEAADKRAEAAIARAVRAEVKALARGFADVDDALVNLGGQLANYVDGDGGIDTEAIESDLAALLERKPHLRKPTVAEPEEQRRSPRPDPSQGPRKEPAPTDFSKASKDELRRELAKYGVRLRT